MSSLFQCWSMQDNGFRHRCPSLMFLSTKGCLSGCGIAIRLGLHGLKYWHKKLSWLPVPNDSTPYNIDPIWLWILIYPLFVWGSPLYLLLWTLIRCSSRLKICLCLHAVYVWTHDYPFRKGALDSPQGVLRTWWNDGWMASQKGQLELL